MKKNLISLSRLNERLTYDPATGVLTWKYCDGIHRDFNKRFAWKPAGTVGKDGYIIINVDKNSYVAHRLGWYMVTGEYPEKHIDHIDGDRANNAFSNLRLATPLENTQNKSFETGRKKKRGTHFRKAEGKWCAKIRHNYKDMWLGFFDSEDSASEAYEAAARELRGEFYRPQHS